MKIKHLFVVLLAFVVLIFASCDQKSPDKGYISTERVNEIVKGFSTTTDYTEYYVTGNFNYFNVSDEEIPRTVEMDYKLKDSLEYFDLQDNNSKSYYLRLPLHITEANWTYVKPTEFTNEEKSRQSTQSRIESALLIVGKTLDKLYYYEDAEGNLIIKTFGSNKALKINEADSIVHAKWNITVIYNNEGYLVSERFETINAAKESDSNTCYGEAKYEFA